jgi:hypothetical protein
MPRRPNAPVSSQQAGRTVSAAIARARLLDIERDRPKRIDQYIDYFGGDGKSGEVFRGAPRHSRGAPTVGRLGGHFGPPM